MILNGSERGPVALPVFKIGRCPLAGQAGFDSQALPPTSAFGLVGVQRLVVSQTGFALRARLSSTIPVRSTTHSCFVRVRPAVTS